AFSPAGTFDGVVPHLDRLRDLGVTAIELMPVAQFPGRRNWGYDGVFPFAVQNSYGGPEGLACLVAECHRRGLAVVLDVVYNHLGPEGEHVGEFGPYFSARSRTPWGKAMNFDGQGGEGPRRFFIENALHWLEDYRIDARRLGHGDPGRAVRRVQPGPRPSGQSGVRPAAHRAGGVRGAEARRRPPPPRPVRPAAVHGGGVRGGGALPLLRQLLPPRAGRGG